MKGLGTCFKNSSPIPFFVSPQAKIEFLLEHPVFKKEFSKCRRKSGQNGIVHSTYTNKVTDYRLDV